MDMKGRDIVLARFFQLIGLSPCVVIKTCGPIENQCMLNDYVTAGKPVREPELPLLRGLQSGENLCGSKKLVLPSLGLAVWANCARILRQITPGCVS
jgi:hypothetical protein